MSARSRAVDEAGGSGFSSVMVTRAGLMLAQGAGRLIRQTSDRGVVSVLDPRVATAGYGRALRASMPPLWFTTSKETTIAALARLHDQDDAAEHLGDSGI
jgi:ATP-dependent DNA helicase DinG